MCLAATCVCRQHLCVMSCDACCDARACSVLGVEVTASIVLCATCCASFACMFISTQLAGAAEASWSVYCFQRPATGSHIPVCKLGDRLMQGCRHLYEAAAALQAV